MTGYNSEITHKGEVYHVQTQDIGKAANCVESIIYKSGKVLASRKTYYTSYLGSPGLRQKIEQITKDQHNTILKEIPEGKFDHL